MAANNAEGDPSNNIGFIGIESPYDQQGGNPPSGNPTIPADEESPPPLEKVIPGFSTAQTEEAKQPQPQAAVPRQKRQYGSMLTIIIVLVIIAAVAGGSYVILTQKHVATTVTTTVSTTVPKVNMTIINGCAQIKSPGKYYFNHNIKVNMSSGACLNVTSSNVEIIGNGNSLEGSGPYSGLPPFTYGIKIGSVSNVTVYDLAVSDFSYGVLLKGTSNSRLALDNFSKDTMSGVLIENASYNVIENSTMFGMASKEGAIYIASGHGNIVKNTTINNNAYYGISVNSTGNSFIGDNLYDNPVDFICYSGGALRNENSFSNVKCATNYYCNFAQCSTTNLPFNISSIVLSSNVAGCGGIYSPGTYTLSKDISAGSFMNTSNPLSAHAACITVLSPAVVLNCNGHTISSGNYGVSIGNIYNVTLENCNIENNSYGIYLSGTLYSKIYNTTLKNNDYGIFINGVSTMGAVNINGTNNTYGAYVSSSTGVLFNRFKFIGNSYGVYMDSGSGNSFNGGTLMNNKNGDLYCTASTYNSTYNLLENTACGLTDCSWGASCLQHEPPPISIYPITGCKTITYPGSYSINNNIVGGNRCINIQTSNVNINCNGHIITGGMQGSAFYINSQQNVSLTNCNIDKFASAINVSNSSFISLQDINISSVSNGVTIANSIYSKIINVNTTSFSGGSAFFISGVNKSVISSDIAADGTGASRGFVFVNSSNNIISYNNATGNSGYGFAFYGANGNNVFNNTAYQNSNDYYCNASSSGIYAELNGVNFGHTKQGCTWLVELTPLTISPSCYAISSASQVTLTNDMLYPYGATCFNIYNTPSSSGNNTVINCNGHTVLATHGGTFVNVANATNVKIENCYIKNFTDAVTDSASYVNVLNNTIATANFSITVGNSRYPYIYNNKIFNASYGIMIESSLYGKIIKNNITSTNIPIQISGGGVFTITNNKASAGSIGLYLINSTLNTLQGNAFTNMSRYGIFCTKSIENSSSLNKDFGGNICSSNHDCYWMTTSSSCAP